MYIDIKNFDDVDINHLIKTDDYHHIEMFANKNFLGVANIKEIERIEKIDDVFFIVYLKCQHKYMCDKIKLVNLKKEVK